MFQLTCGYLKLNMLLWARINKNYENKNRKWSYGKTNQECITCENNKSKWSETIPLIKCFI